MSSSALPQIRCPAHSAICSVQNRRGQLRRFYTCSLPPGRQCSFFKWVDQAQREQFRQGGKNTGVSPGKRPRSSFEGSGIRVGNRFRANAENRVNDAIQVGNRPGADVGNNENDNSNGIHGSSPNDIQSHQNPVEEENPPPMCECADAKPCVLRTVRKEGANTGRTFWTCEKPYGGPRCNAFRWADQGPVQGSDDGRGNRVSQGDGSQRLGGDGVNTQFVKRFRASDPVELKLESLEKFSFELPLSAPPALLKDIQDIPGVILKKTSASATGTLFGITRALVPLLHHVTLVQILETHQIRFADLHRPLLTAINRYSRAKKKRLESAYGLKPDGTADPEQVVQLVGKRLFTKMMGFQREGVEYALERGGRCLIGDDMGLGKTVQAIAIASVYRQEWPLLIVCPSSLRLNWKEELLRWLGRSSSAGKEDLDDFSDQENDIDPLFDDAGFGDNSRYLRESEINVIMTGRDCPRGLSLVNIVSYDLVKKIDDHELQQCGFIIADESHYLKTMQAKRTKFVGKLVRTIPRAILLSGTPALSRPVELFPQVSALEPELYPSFNAYASRYCNAHQSRFGMDYSGASNLDELHTVLRASCLVRRKKTDVLTELPAKTRQMVYVETKPKIIKQISKLFNDLDKAQSAASSAQSERSMQAAENAARTIQTKLYQLSADAKMDAMLDYIRETADCTDKFIVFGHHKETLDRIETFLRTKLKIDLIRLDGSTASHKRQGLCKKFQTVPSCRAGVLSITAAGVGLNLTATSVVIFAELFWNPGSLLQAEDRAHRIGQKDHVNIKYLMGKNTMDDRIWNLIKKKMTIVGRSLTGAAMEMEESNRTVARPGSAGPMGRLVKNANKRTFNARPKMQPKLENANDNSVILIDDDTIETDDWDNYQQNNEPKTHHKGTSSQSLHKRTSAYQPPGSTQTKRLGDVPKRVPASRNTDLDIDLDDMFPSLDEEPRTGAGNAQDSLDADLALAKKLQAQFDAEYGQF
eukprot:Plantae.Rhodophyta-Hildenbrandia_rubra.ctg11719.p1 GENE.Plantae.Rhodophyta-Hildenbrandia_rubra.ctg11719~~Plantae.Rhodophyta-Hildenbrandia_rubra.ctg11719.p1  ORF type:complete len:985 (+),score=150.95 Plantae.Rhodophyta-Hildenbrandia_rubra.ctg11719:121-3075(+)